VIRRRVAHHEHGFVPKLVTTLKGYTRTDFRADLTAGVIVGIVALPLSIAFAIASGVTPDRGLWTAIVAGFLISALGGSRVQIGGPTGAFVVIVYGIVQQYGVDGLIVATLMAGVILVAMGLLKFGAAIKFIPHPVIIGFTSGIALIIFSSQVKDFLGLTMGTVPAEFVEKWGAYGEAISHGRPGRGRSSRCSGSLIVTPLAARDDEGAEPVRRAHRHDARRAASAGSRWRRSAAASA
jgi:SulP family sulfate permease